MKRNPFARIGFTLVELLVVIAIIAILIALLLPAIQQTREAARRSQCTSNIRQICLACLGYEDNYKRYPPGAYWYGDSDRNRGSILIYLLPFLEQKALYDMVDFNKRIDSQRISGTGPMIDSQAVPVYICPSDNNPVTAEGRSPVNYAACAGPTAHIDNPNCSCGEWSAWNNFALAPYSVANNYAGVFYRRGVATTARQITDGLSYTIFFGEVRPSCSSHVARSWGGSNNGQGLISTLIPINRDTCISDSTSGDGCRRWCNWSTELGFKSRHPGGANFVFGDCGVRFLTEEIDHWTYQYLGGKADKKAVEIPD